MVQTSECPRPSSVSTPYGYGALEADTEGPRRQEQQQEDHPLTPDEAGAAAFTRVKFPWGHAYVHSHLVTSTPVFTFYALTKVERIKFTLSLELNTLGAAVIEAVKKKLSLGDDVALSLVQTDAFSKHEIAPDQKIGESTVGAGPNHPILVLQTQLPRFDNKKCSMYTLLHESNTLAIQVAKGFGSVLGTFEIANGVKYWEVVLQSARGGEGVFLGVSTADVALNGSMLNRSIFWGISCATGHKFHEMIDYYAEPCQDGDVMGVLLDMTYGRLSFYRNGTYLGVAYRDIQAKRLFPIFSMTCIGQKLKLLPTASPPLS